VKWSARSDLHAQGCLILSQVGLLFPVNHAPKSWRSWRDSHPLVIRLERATARRLYAQEQLTLGRDGRSRAGNLLDVTELLCYLSYVPSWLPRMDSHHQHPASEAGVLLIELRIHKWWEVLVTLQFVASDFVLRHPIYSRAAGSLPWEMGAGAGVTPI
jgi:hypothetical protein